MAAALASFGGAVLVEHAFNQDVDLGILAVALAMTLARGERTRRSSSLALSAAVLVASAIAAGEVGQLMFRKDRLGDALLVFAFALAIWLRRFGSGWTKVGAVLTLPFVAALVTPYAPQGGFERDAWWGAIALLVFACVVATGELARRTGFVTRTEPVAALAPAQDAQAPAGRAGLLASTRMAAQMAVALAAAFVVGRDAFGDHWSWTVLTAFIVSSGNRGRADVLYKGVLRTVGAVAGTAAATGLSGQFAPGDKVSVALIFAVLGIGTWLRSFNYAYWAACMTAALALLYGYFGQSGGDLLQQRLQGILAGAACGVVAAWIVLPVRTTDVVRRRTSNLLGALAELLTVIRDDPARIVRRHATDVLVAIGALDQIAPPLRVRRRLAGGRPSAAWQADIVDAADALAAPVRTIVRQAAQRPETLAGPRVREIGAVTLDNVVAAREALRSLSVPELRALPERASQTLGEGGDGAVRDVLLAADDVVEAVARGIARDAARRRHGRPRERAGLAEQPVGPDVST